MLRQSERELHAELSMSRWKRSEADQCSETCGSKKDDSRHAEQVYKEHEKAHGEGSHSMIVDDD